MKNLSKNPSSIRIRFALRFLRAMKKLNKNKPPNPSSTATKYKRCHLIRAAAYASMASAVGPKRAWSRALLRKIRNKSFKLNTSINRRNGIRRRRSVRGNPRRNIQMESQQENNLRELVPGGEAMDSCKLLIETAHYIQCLKAQIEIMRNIADHFSR